MKFWVGLYELGLGFIIEERRRTEKKRRRERNDLKNEANRAKIFLYRRAGPGRFRPDPAPYVLGR